MRGGTYTLTSTISISKSGTSSKSYYLLAYNSERPILDFSSMSESSSNRGINLSGSYWYIKGIDIKGAGDNGMNMSGSYNTVEYCAFYLNRDSGLQLGGGAAYNNIINCDSYFNKDAGEGNADGFAVKLDVGTGNYYYGCRSWQNSDDGWDGYLRPSDDINTTLENCWCFMNGYRADGTASTGNGNGFKLGGSDAKDLRHNFTLKKCISFDNRVKGFDQNNNKGSMTLYNCTGYRNGTNYSFVTALDTGKTLTLINCVVLGSLGNISIASTQQTNSWMSPFSVSTADFQSVDTTGMRGPRNADGSLPTTNFMHLATGSDLIDAGTNVGLAYNGTAPDLGFYETGVSSSLASVATTVVTSITQTTASSGGTISADGGTSITARGVCWNTSGSPTTSNSYTSDGTGTGTFISSLTGLTVGTTYYVRAYAVNGSGTSYGSQVSFTTSAAVVPMVTTSSVSSITQTTASCGGTITSNGGAAVTAYGVCWNTTGSPTLSNSHTTDGSGTASFTSSLSGLAMGTTYYVAAYATNSAGTAYGSTVSFTTLPVSVPTVTTSTTSAITLTSASSGGTVISDGGASVTSRGVCWNTSGTPTITDSHTSDGSGIGSFTSVLTSLVAGTMYHVRAYATNSIGTSYGGDSTFTTLSSAQSDSVKWALTANQTCTSGSHVNGNTQVLSSGGGVLSMSVKDYSAGSTNGGERLNLGSTSWPTETAQNDSRYAEFSMTPAVGYDFTVNSITFDVGYSGTTGHMFSNLYYSLDNWATRTKINTDSIVSANSAWNSPAPSFTVSISVLNGKTLALRIYPWYNGSPSTTKYLSMRNFVVKGKTGPNAASLSGAVAVNVIPQGYYNSGGYLNATDTIGVYLAQQSSPYAYVDSTKAILDSVAFSASTTFSNAASGSYYLVIKHRNCIETWSASTIAFAKGSSVSYDFTSAQSKAYGNNLVQVSASPVRWAIYSGDVNQDGYVDPLDLSLVDQASFNYASGAALVTDINGDGYVDPLDLSIVDQNSFSYVGIQNPRSARVKHKLVLPEK